MILNRKSLALTILMAGMTIVLFAPSALADTAAEIQQRIEALEKDLEQARKELATVETGVEPEPPKVEEAESPKKRELNIGGAIRASYVYGDYHQNPTYYDSGPNTANAAPAYTGDRRGRNVGGFMFDTFRINVDFTYDNIIGSFEHRWWWYLKNAGYSSLSRAWLGYEFDNAGTLKAGIVRKPFGPGPYGISSSWFYDQHFYVGLSDDRDTGITWTKTFDNLTLDLGYFLQAQPNGEGGTTRDSIRYDYDVVKWDLYVNPDTGGVSFPGWTNPSDPRSTPCNCGFQEQHQFNVRAIYAVENIGEFGASFQYGMLDGTRTNILGKRYVDVSDDPEKPNLIPILTLGDDDGKYYAFSAHAKNPIGDFTLYSQLTYYEYDITDNTPWGTGDLIPMGGYDYSWLVASRGWIPAVNLRYSGLDVPAIWPSLLSSIQPESITPYIEWSSIMKLAHIPMGMPNAGNAFNDNSLLTIGAAWAKRGWYIYTDWVFSTGNLFVGNDYGGCNYCNIYDTGGANGASGRDDMKQRFNINFGYYF